MVKNWLQRIETQLRETVADPGAQLTRGQRLLRFSIDLARHARRELSHHSAPTMAAALTYRTIFGLVPMIVMALIVFKAFGGFAGSQQGLTDLVYKFLNIEDKVQVAPLEPDDFVEQAPQSNADEPADTSRSDLMRWFDPTGETVANGEGSAEDELAQAERARLRANAEMRQRIDELINSLAEGATSVRLGGIGVVGMLLLIWAALGLVVTVENTFNRVFDAPSGRPWHLRIPIYWATITLGPVLIWGSFYLSTQFIDATQGIPVLGFLVGLVKQFTALLVTWLLFLLLFTLLPNSKVAIKPAMIGAMVSALAWEAMKAALRWYIDSAVINPTHARLYGSLALIPLFLFWVYMTWLVILAGLEMTHILQTLPAHRVGRFAPGPKQKAAVPRDPWLVIPVMSAIAQRFEQGKSVQVDEIAERVGAPGDAVQRIADDLVDRGMLHRLSVGDGLDAYTLALPPSRIRVAELIDSHGDDDAADRPGRALLRQLAEAQDAALANATLADDGAADRGGAGEAKP